MGNVRVRGHNYRGKGYYFITFGTLNRKRWLSRIVDGKVILEPAGELLIDAWHKIAKEDGDKKPDWRVYVVHEDKKPRGDQTSSDDGLFGV